jgi:peptidoglycan hydrolase CwlO-like protein
VLEEQQGNDMLGLLEDRIEQSINLIHRLRQDKSALEEEVDRLQDEIRQRDLKVQEIEAQNDSLKDTEAELYQLKVKQTETQEETEREKKELRSRLEGIMELLDGVNSEDTLEDTLEDAPEDTPPDQQSFLKLQEEDES